MTLDRHPSPVPLLLPQSGSAIVHVIDPAAISDEQAVTVLSLTELEQASRFRFERDARHWKACRSSLRQILGKALDIKPAEVPFEFEEFGKPLLPEPFSSLHFNLSHCHDLALVALCSDGPVGIDVENADRGANLIGCEHAFCHPDEIASLPEKTGPRADALLDLWTSKEALLKAIGTGMSLAPETVSLLPPGEHGAGQHPRIQPFRLHRLEHPLLQKHVARVAVPLVTQDILIVS